jgi:hypothetical protein
MPNSITGKKIFGAGRFFGINNVSNPTPARFYVPQDNTIDFKIATKTLTGENKFPVAVAQGDISVTGKVTYGAQNARVFADLLFNLGSTTGTIIEQEKETATIPSTPFQVTVANGATFKQDLGVMLASDGTVFVQVASSPATGQYSLNTTTGVYTFNSSDTGKAVVISYLYASASTGEKLVMTNSLQGPAGAFTGVSVFPYGSDQDVLILNNCIASDAGIGTKQGDYVKPSFGYMAATDSSDTLGTFAFSQAA